MNTTKNILIAFLLNISFSIIEFFGGLFTNSVAIISDAIHDMGDAISIGISYFLEKKSKKSPDDVYTFGYARYSILGAFITTTILTVGSLLVIYNSVIRIINPVEINYNGMILFAVFGTIINFLAAYFTRDGNSLNQKAVNLHMLEDVLGWIVVLVGSIIMKFTDIRVIDSLMSMGVAVFILVNCILNMKSIGNLFLEKKPDAISIEEIRKHLLSIEGVKDVHHIHVWSIDGKNILATMHVVSDSDIAAIKKHIREEMEEHGISHVTIEVEASNDVCDDINCHVKAVSDAHMHHHH